MDSQVRKICDEMFEQRGYVYVDSEDPLLEDVEAVALKPDGEFVLLCTCLEGRINTAKIQHFISIVQSYEVKHSIIVHRSKLTAIGRKMISEVNALFRIEMFAEETLKFNPTKHHLVPKHDLHLAATNAKNFKAKYANLPVLLRSDPIVLFLGFGVGDVVQISRHDGLVVYRQVK